MYVLFCWEQTISMSVECVGEMEEEEEGKVRGTFLACLFTITWVG